MLTDQINAVREASSDSSVRLSVALPAAVGEAEVGQAANLIV